MEENLDLCLQRLGLDYVDLYLMHWPSSTDPSDPTKKTQYKDWNFVDWADALGTINHPLLSIEALRSRRMRLHGVVFVGDDNPDNIRTIGEISGARVLGRLPRLEPLDRAALLGAFARGFRREDF